MGSVRLKLLGVFIWISLAQIKYTQAQACDIITSITSTSASSLLVRWNSYAGATNYFLDLRVNSTGVTGVSPVVVTLSAFTTQKEVFGLRAGTFYTVVVKVFQFYRVACLDSEIARTVPDASQLNSSKAISSTAIMLEWEKVYAVDQYFLLVNSSLTGEHYNLSFTGTSAVVQNLRPFTTYDCYVVTSNTAGLGARSRVRTVSTLVQPPVVVTVEQTSTQSARIRWQPVDKVLLYKVTVTDSRGVQLLSSIISSTFLDVQKIMPCSTYQISVSSVNTFLEPGESKVVNYSTNTLSPVTSISVDYSCGSSSATVSWGPVNGADSYRAIARTHNGTTLSCSSLATSCQLTGVGCGGDFTVQVVSISNTCESVGNTTTHFQTEPCAPGNLQLYRECSSNVIIFSWAPINNTDYYTAIAVDTKGVQQECLTTETSCFFTDTICGDSYNLSVSSRSSKCSGEYSSVVHIKTAPCKPSNLHTMSECQQDSLKAMWDASAGAVRYMVEGFGNHGNGSHYTCSSSTTSCTIPGVVCGESLTMQITAFDDECYSELALGNGADTVPCVPQNVSAAIDCGSDSITITWMMASGASSYIVTARDAGGVEHTCVTDDLKCQIKGLHCGSTYNASVISTNFKCNSSASTTITVDTAPCPPSQVHATLDCDRNSALISWQGLRGSSSFTATMEDQRGGLLSCTTISSSCWVPNLNCDQVYDITVTYHDGICSSKPSLPIYMKSVPCGPQNVHAQVECSTGVVQVGWNRTVGASGYSARIVASTSGAQLYCNSTSPSCTITSLSCGESYFMQVQSYNETCHSVLSPPLIFQEVPCAPTHVEVRPTCGNSTVVTWQASHGTLSYRVVATSNGRNQTQCSTNGTSCVLPDLRCSRTYNVSVSAADGACGSLETQNVILQTAPCAPANIHGSLNCTTNAVELSWDPSPNAAAYSGRAVGSDGHSVSCSSRTPRCQLMALRCGQDYSIRVTASAGACVSPESDVYIQHAAPCAPEDVSSSLQCDGNSLSVSWAPAASPLNYSALARLTNSTTLSCTSDSISCDITGLQCGQTYSVFITATNMVCTGPESVYQTIQTAPCVPASVRASVTCASNTVRAWWAQAPGALSYTSVLSGPGGYNQTCSTSSLSCSFGNLACAENYKIHVVASDRHCNSTVSQDISVTTAPCSPDSVSAELLCDSGGVGVSWHASAGGSTYIALAYAANQTAPLSSCLANGTSCAITQLLCGTVFNVSVLAGDGTCNSSVRMSTTVKTAPCPPLLQSPPLGCADDHATVSWTVSQDVTAVSVNATSALGHSVGCGSAGRNTSCTLQRLQCGQTYAVRAAAQGPHCSSSLSAPLSIVTVPCTPAWVTANYTCSTGQVELSWAQSQGAESFTARVEAGDHAASCGGRSTRCTLSSLLCGRVYNVSMQAAAGQCNSSSVARTQLQTAPCVPQNVSVSLQCTNNTASVSWTGSLGAVGYVVSAVSRGGDTRSCRTLTHGCRLPGMSCGQTYNVVVTPFSSTCDGSQSTAITFTAGPCPPTGVQVNLVCVNNIASVRWLAVPNAEMYIAKATAMDGQTSSCTTNTTTCSFLDLSCGKNYTVTVVTLERGCWSNPSPPVMLTSAICPPKNLAGSTQCRTNDITITWDPSPGPGATYFLFSQQVGGANSTTSTTATSVTLTGLLCGLVFTVRVAAQDNTCTSSYSPPVQIHTAPCPPSGLAVTAECGTNLGRLSWVGGVGAVLYIAALVSDEGHVVSCRSNSTSCVAKLECNHRYTATVVSSYGTCNSSANSSAQFSSAPCLAGNVQAQLDCVSNTLAVRWAAISGDLGLYTALAIGSNGLRASCNTSSTSCTIQRLQCGHTYSIAVTTSNIHCDVLGSDYQVQTVPCEAQRPSVSLVCSTNVATVTWDSNGVDQSYKVSAVNFTGGQADCVSSSTSCTFGQFNCGETYELTVTGVTQQCSSQPSTSLELNTAPCVPTHVIASFDCNSLITTVMWDMSRGAESYVVYAVGSMGESKNCTNIDTSCIFQHLPCGQDFTFTVVALHGECMSLPSQPVTVSTGPCPLSNPDASLDCSSNSALVSWTPGVGILFYNASAVTFDTDDRTACSSAGSTCNMTELQCATVYQITITGQGQTCLSTNQEFVLLNTAPCPPNNVSIHTSCTSSVVSVSWAASEGSLSYLAVAQSNSGHRATCNSTRTACDITGLHCGQTYKVHVSGMDDKCVGPNSESRTFKTAPCVPQNVQPILQCQATVLNVTWQQTGEATRYRVMVQSNNSQPVPCDTDRPFCTFPNILCGRTYSIVAVVAQNEMCNTSYSTVQAAVSAPCPPQTVSAVLDCVSDTISVTWSPSAPGVSYVARAVSPSAAYACNGTSGGCNVSVACGDTYNVSVTPVHNGCRGSTSTYTTIQSAPCGPVLTQVQMDCLSDSAWVMWEKSAGAEFYVAVATNGDGQQYACNSSSSMCAIDDLPCGDHYNFSVAALNSQCLGGVSNLVESETAPCAPEDVNTVVECLNGTATVQWAPTAGALHYMATLESAEGNSYTCCGLQNATSCQVSSLPCGNIYLVRVIAGGHTCNSSESDVTIARTAPCTPVGLNASLSCSKNVATMSWTTSAGGQIYTVNALNEDGSLADSCDGLDNSCDLNALACGQRYTAEVVARDSACTSPPSWATHFRTVPCVPEGVSVHVGCSGRSLSVSWQQSAGATHYTATVMDSRGRSTTCSSTLASCGIAGLSCGNIYHSSVVASDAHCSSKPSLVVDTDSVPCPPRGIQAVLDCQTDSALLSWQPGAGALSYTATAVSTSGHTVSCAGSDTNCELFHLTCGSKYQISVLGTGQNCSSSASMTGYLETGPCPPNHFSMSYTPSIAQLMWDPSTAEQNYTAVAMSPQGVQASCSSQDTFCVLSDLACGHTYRVTVTADSDICPGNAVSSPLSLDTEPCPPTNVRARSLCPSALGVVSWEPSVGAVRYVATLEGRAGDTLSCQTNETSCSVSGLQCGEDYLATVWAVGSEFNSSGSVSALLTTAPCLPDPRSITAAVNCDNNTALVKWAWSNGALSYEVTVLSNDSYRATCSSNENQCSFTNLVCGQTYSVIMVAVNSVCQVPWQTGLTFQTWPCVPKRVAVNLKCGTSTAVLTWEQRPEVLYYQAQARVGDDRRLCNSSSDSCQFSGLQCGTEYSFSVRAFGSQCHSDPSSTVKIRTEPCQPQHLTVGGTCENKTLHLQWDTTSGALDYAVVARGSLGYITTFQTNESTLEAELPCGQRYNITVIGKDERCRSPPSTPAYYTTAPCVPRYVETFVECEGHVGSVNWAGSDGAETYIAVANGVLGHTHMCSTNGTSCTWDDLVCGETYVVRVIASDASCSSAPSNSTVIHMAPCVPQKVVSNMNCVQRVATLTWLPSLSAQSYLVTAEASSVHKVALTTNDTIAQISELQCGLLYFLTVRAVGQRCRSSPSNTSLLQTDPCPPTWVFASVDCFTNIAVVSWSPSDTADYYAATALGPDGELETCMSSDTSCGIATLQCGQKYLVTVTAHRRLCSSAASPATNLTTVPCIPMGVSVVMNCGQNEAYVTWSSSQGALFYHALAESTNNDTTSCYSAGNVNSCDLQDLPCGVVYTVYVVAIGEECPSLLSKATVFHTVPCKVTIGSVYLNCSTNSLLVDWNTTTASVTYTAVARASGGQASSCSTSLSSCSLTQLACGETYNVSLVASDGQCSSLQSHQRVSSVPCRPVNVISSMNCSSQSAHVQWLPDSGAESYQVQVVGTRGLTARCTSTHTSCSVHNVLCGDVYNVSVVAISNRCSVTGNAVTPLSSGPCAPNHLETSLNCTSGAVTVSWEPSPGAAYYTAVARAAGGFPSSCTSNGTACVFGHLLCGLTYDFTVSAASNDGCNSAFGHQVALSTVPCQPQQVTTQMDCVSSTGLVSWEPGEGVSFYMVSAVSSDGHQLHCNSGNSSCSLDSMHCGQRYDLNITAQDNRCNSSAAHFNMNSVPCAPTAVQTTLMCDSNSVGVSWQRASGALGYQAEGVSVDRRHVVSCNSSLLHCDLQQLYCGTYYSVSVVARDSACRGSSSALTRVRTAPCPPQQVLAQMNCPANTLNVSWAANPDADSYHVDAVASGSANLSCDATGTSCSFGPLPCGVSYAVTVRSIRAGCLSGPGRAVQVSSVPCIPDGEKGSLDCVTNSVWVSWQPTVGAESYAVLAIAPDGSNSTCGGSGLYCNVPKLMCGVTYTFSIKALNSQCSSASGNSFQIETAPCPLTGITMQSDCGSSSIRVGWNSKTSSSLYVVTAMGQDNSFLECNSSSTSCVLQGARCGLQYTMMVSASSDKCSSLRSLPYTINTAPCAPENVMVRHTCEAAGVLVSWSRSALAESYDLTAVGADGDVRNCSSPAPNCSLSQLRCGHSYTLSITAYASNCSSPPSQPVTFHTTPCAPRGLEVVTNCTDGTATLSWPTSSSSSSHGYVAMAHGSLGDELHCVVPQGSANASCSVVGLQCGAIYNFTVYASDGTCNSSAGLPVQKGAVPCPPDLVKVRVHVDVSYTLIRVSWSPVTCQGVKYLVELTGFFQSDPHSVLNVSSYWTNRTYFEFPVPSDLIYAVTVRAGNQAGSSVPLTAVTGTAGPVSARRKRDTREAKILAAAKIAHVLPVPEITNIQVNGNSLHVEWTPLTEASHYTLIVRDDTDSDSHILIISDKSCNIDNLRPTTHYCITLSAKNSISQSDFSSPLCVTTEGVE